MASTKAADKATGQSVVKAEENTNVPAYLKDKMGSGSGLKADADDFIIPRIKLLHGTSKEPESFNTAKAGNYWITTVDISLGEAFDFVVVSNRKRVMLLRPIDDKTGESILARAENGRTWDKTGEWQVKLKNIKAPVTWTIADPDVRKSGLLEFGTSNPDDEDSSPAATVFHDYLVYLPKHPELGPLLMSCARTAAKKAKALNSKIEMGGGPMQSMVFTASVVKDNNDGGQEFFNMEFRRNGFATEDEFNKCMAYVERYKSYRSADEEDEARDSAATGGTTATMSAEERAKSDV